MSIRILIKDQLAERRLLFRRSLVAAVIIVVLLSTLIARMAFLQVVNYQHYTMLSQDNRVKLVALPPPRGLIYDRNGIILADNRPSFRLVLTPEEVKDVNDTVQRLGEIIEFSESDLTRFRELLARTRRFEEVPLKVRLTEQEVARFAVDRHRFPGVDVQAQAMRHYPLGAVGVHAIGYVGRINAQELQRLSDENVAANYSGSTHIGKLGVEHSYEELLHGTVGVEKVETNALGRVIRTLERTPPVPGKDIYLSLDIRLQQVAERALGDYTGAAVVIAPKTGEVLAFVSQPTYDPNLFVNGIDIENYKALQQDVHRPLFNRALRGQYPPGSTVKPLIALAALEHGATGAYDKVYCPGYYMLPGVDHRYRDWKRGGHGHVDMTEAIAQSCDVYFYDVAYKLGIDDMSSFLRKFSLGNETGIDLGGEATGLMPSREWKRAAKNQPWFHGETLITGIGQGFMLATPLQLATATATLANRGKKIRPHLLHGVGDTDSGRQTPFREPPGAPVTVRQDRYWDDIIEAMRQVVHGRTGTARGVGRDLEYEMAGKTGTAQVFSIAQDARYNAEELERALHDHALFVAFAPAKDPEVALAVVVEHGGSGSGVAAPVARQILDAYMTFKKADAQRNQPKN